MNFHRDERGEGSNLGTIIVVILALPIVIGMLSTAGFVAWWKSRSTPAATPAPVAAPAVASSKPAAAAPSLCPEAGDTACNAFLQAVETARAGDAVKLRRYMSTDEFDIFWERIQKVSAPPEQRGALMAMRLLGGNVDSLEELAHAKPEVLQIKSRTSLDAQDATLDVKWRSSSDSERTSKIQMRKLDGVWTVSFAE